MTWWDRFLHDLVPTAVMACIVVAAVAVTGWVLVTIVGPRLDRRRRQRARDCRWEAFRKQLDETVPMRTGQGGGR